MWVWYADREGSSVVRAQRRLSSLRGVKRKKVESSVEVADVLEGLLNLLLGNHRVGRRRYHKVVNLRAIAT